MRLCLFCFALLAVQGLRADGVGFPKPDAADTLRESFVTPPPGYGEVPFWWWTGDKLDKRRLLYELEELHQAGISGTQINYSHRRSNGWPTETVDPPIFSDEWWDIFAFVAEESAKRGMGIGLSGYTLDWPGGDNLWTQLGISAPDTRAHELTMKSYRSKGGAVKIDKTDDLVSVTAYHDRPEIPHVLLYPGNDKPELPEGEWTIYSVSQKPQNGTLDPLNPESAKRVIERFLNPFEQRLPESARKALNYFFQDELRLGGDLRLWSEDFASEFKRRKGYDILPLLPRLCATSLVAETVKTRLDYNDVQVALTEERYFKPIFDWHNSRGLIYACDPASRGYNVMSFGDYMRSMRWYTAPGFDTPGTSADVIKNKVGSSIAHLYRRPRVWLEGYHSQGWQASTETIFDSSVHNFVYGSTLLNLHGLYYSTYGGWWEWAPPCYHFRMPYWKHLKGYLKYFERLSFLLSQGDHVADVAVVNPLEPVVADRNMGAGAVSTAHQLVRKLATEKSCDVDFIDADSIANAKISDGCLCAAGERYRVAVVPAMPVIKAATAKKLAEFAKSGGRVVLFGEPPKMTDGDIGTLDELSRCATLKLDGKFTDESIGKLLEQRGTADFYGGPDGVKVLHRRIGPYNAYYMVDFKNDAVCRFRVVGEPEIWDAWTGKQTKVNAWRREDDGTVSVRLSATGQPLLVVFAPSSGIAASRGPEWNADVKTKTIASETVLDGEWDFTLIPTMDNRWGDFRLPAFDGKIGAELRWMTTNGQRMTLGFGPQFRRYGPFKRGAELDAKTAELGAMRNLDPTAAGWQPVTFSWRWGDEHCPAYQDWHHGLNRKVGDDFFVFGNYNRGLYDVVPRKESEADSWLCQTAAYAPEACEVIVETSGIAPSAVWVDGQIRQIGVPFRLEPGWRTLLARYDRDGRAAVVLVRSDIRLKTKTVPLAMRWYNNPAVLRFDPFGGQSEKTTEWTASVPPAFESAELVVRGTVESASTGAGVAKVTAVRDEGNGWRQWRVDAGQVDEHCNTLTLRITADPGCPGATVFQGPIALRCGTGKTVPGDWAQNDGLACYSGGAVYRRTIRLDRPMSDMTELDLGKVSATCAVRVNGHDAAVLTAPPWKTEIGKWLKTGDNEIEVTVYNTLNNHYQTIPTRYKKPISQVPSGLLGPVKLREIKIDVKQPAS